MNANLIATLKMAAGKSEIAAEAAREHDPLTERNFFF